MALTIDEGVCIVQIQGDAKQPVASGPLVLTGGLDELQVECGDFKLVFSKGTPVIKKEARLFVIVVPPAFHGISVGPEVAEEQLARLEALLGAVGSLRCAPGVEAAVQTPASSSGGTLAAGITACAAATAGVILATGEITSSLIMVGGKTVKDNVKPAAEPMQVSATAAAAASGARQAAGLGRDVVGGVASGVAVVAAGVGGTLASALKDTSVGRVGDGTGHGVRQVATASVGAVGQILGAVDTAARTVLSGAAEATTGVVEHKYGEQAGAVAGDALGAAIDAADAVRGAGRVGVKAMAKAAGKELGKQLLETDAGEQVGGQGQRVGATPTPATG